MYSMHRKIIRIIYQSRKQLIRSLRNLGKQMSNWKRFKTILEH